MAALVDVDHVIAFAHQLLCRLAPGIAGLAAAMKQEDGWCARVAADIDGERDITGPNDSFRLEQGFGAAVVLAGAQFRAF
jgi:hypothetical protein